MAAPALHCQTTEELLEGIPSDPLHQHYQKPPQRVAWSVDTSLKVCVITWKPCYRPESVTKPQWVATSGVSFDYVFGDVWRHTPRSLNLWGPHIQRHVATRVERAQKRISMFCLWWVNSIRQSRIWLKPTTTVLTRTSSLIAWCLTQSQQRSVIVFLRNLGSMLGRWMQLVVRINSGSQCVVSTGSLCIILQTSIHHMMVRLFSPHPRPGYIIWAKSSQGSVGLIWCRELWCGGK